MTTMSFEQTLVAARQLSPQERARLIAQLATELATPIAKSINTTVSSDAWTQLAQLRQEFSQLYPNARLADRLEADRQERENSLTGRGAGNNVHA